MKNFIEWNFILMSYLQNLVNVGQRMNFDDVKMN